MATSRDQQIFLNSIEGLEMQDAVNQYIQEQFTGGHFTRGTSPEPHRIVNTDLFSGVEVRESPYIPEGTVMTIPRRERLDFVTHERPGQFFVNPQVLERLERYASLDLAGHVRGNSPSVVVEDEINEDGDALERLR